jgi:hypothetical protein
MYFRIFHCTFKYGNNTVVLDDAYGYKNILHTGTIEQIMDAKYDIYIVDLLGDISNFGERRFKGTNGMKILKKINKKCITMLHDDTAVYYFRDCKFHRDDDRPAVVFARGRIEYFIDGIRHRDEGPAIACVTGYKAFYKNGKLHNDKGAAIVHPSGAKEYFVDGKPKNNGIVTFIPAKLNDYYKINFNGLTIHEIVSKKQIIPPSDDLPSMEKFIMIESQMTTETPHSSPELRATPAHMIMNNCDLINDDYITSEYDFAQLE